MQNRKTIRTLMILLAISISVFILIFAGITLTKDLGKSQKTVTAENAMETLDNLYKDVTVNMVPARKGQVTIETTSVKDALPDISKYPPQVDNETDSYIEIFSSTEKTGEKRTDGLLTRRKHLTEQTYR